MFLALSVGVRPSVRWMRTRVARCAEGLSEGEPCQVAFGRVAGGEVPISDIDGPAWRCGFSFHGNQAVYAEHLARRDLGARRALGGLG
jgi:hypothetical protein